MFKFIDLCSGIGGLRIPFDELGGECVYASEIDKFAIKTYEHNHNHKPEDDFEIVVSDTQAYKQFGNSVCVPVVREIAKKLMPHINKMYCYNSNLTLSE